MIEIVRENCYIRLNEIYGFRSDLQNPVNGSITVTVDSILYTGTSVFDIDIKELNLFFIEVVRLWTTLEVGEASIQEPFSFNRFLSIKSIGNGHFEVIGKLKFGDFVNNSFFTLNFSERFDQSCFNNFINEIKKYKFDDYLN